MKLYVANTSKQHHDFICRLPEATRTLTVRIPAGRQVQVGPDLSAGSIDAIIAQHSRYGMIDAREALKRHGYAGLCYSVDKPVSNTQFAAAYHANEEALQEQAEENRENAAAAIAQSIDENTGGLAHLDVKVSEVTKPGETPRVNSGIEVTRDGTAPRHGGKTRKSGGRRTTRKATK